VFEGGDCRVVGVFVEDGEAVAAVSVGKERWSAFVVEIRHAVKNACFSSSEPA